MWAQKAFDKGVTDEAKAAAAPLTPIVGGHYSAGGVIPPQPGGVVMVQPGGASITVNGRVVDIEEYTARRKVEGEAAA